LFGEIRDGKMILNEFGILAQKEWLHTPKIRPNILLGPFIVMPDHIHGIIVIQKEIKQGSLIAEPSTNEIERKGWNSTTAKIKDESNSSQSSLPDCNQVGDVFKSPDLITIQYFKSSGLISLGGFNPPQTKLEVECEKPITSNGNLSFSPALKNEGFRSPSQTLGAILRGYMGTVTRQINTIRNTQGEKIWQRGYHDRIIRNKWEYHRISMYIIRNPKKWKEK